MSPIVVVMIAIGLVVGMLLWGGALADAADYPPEAFVAAGRTKRSTITFVALTFAVGGLWYWLRIRTGVRRAAAQIR